MFGWLSEPATRLAQEALRERGVGRVERGQLLERDESVQVGLAREVHHRHAAATHFTQDLVATDGLQDIWHRLTSLSWRLRCTALSILTARA